MNRREGTRDDGATGAWGLPLEEIAVADPTLFRHDSHWAYFERLRKEDPVHYSARGDFGPYWSLTKYEDITRVNIDHQGFSSASGISYAGQDQDFETPMFIATDPPVHHAKRKSIAPIFSPSNLAKLEETIRTRTRSTLAALPRNETFDWVPAVSAELTAQMLATLFDVPWEDRKKLTRWSDIETAGEGSPLYMTADAKRAELLDCLDYFTRLWNERVNAPVRPDLISMLAHGESTRDMDRMEFLGNLLLLIVAGTDTTRNSMTGAMVAFQKHPDQWAKLKADPGLVPSAVAEIIRWQTPLAHMRRTAVRDVELRGKRIREGDKVLLWYISGNFDEEVFAGARDLNIERSWLRPHLSFGVGIHRCLGSRLSELQLKIFLEELLSCVPRVDVLGEPSRLHSCFMRGYLDLPVRIPG